MRKFFYILISVLQPELLTKTMKILVRAGLQRRENPPKSQKISKGMVLRNPRNRTWNRGQKQLDTDQKIIKFDKNNKVIV